MSNEEKITLSKESAESQFQIFLDYYDIDLDDEDDDEVLQANKSVKRKVIKAIQKGYVEFKEENDTLNVYQHLKKPMNGVDNPIIYYEPTGYAKIAMKESGKEDYFGKMYNLLGGMCKHGKAIFVKMKGKDLSIAESLALLFLDI